MSSEILTDRRSAVTPVLWRKVSLVTEDKTKRSRHDAEQELQQRLEQARRAGMEEGLFAGRAESEQQLPSILENIARARAELAQTRDRVRIEAAQDLVRLARTVAARLIHREMITDSAALAGLIKAAFLKLQQREITRVRMHPALESVVAKTLEQCGAPAATVLMPDTGLASGELLFETAQGTLDASLDTQLRELERALMDKLRRN